MPHQIPPAAAAPWREAPPPEAPLPHVEAAMLRALQRLDPALARWQRAEQRWALVRRLVYGVTGHFATRVPEWFAAAVLLQLGLTLVTPPPSFPLSPGWDAMARWGSEEHWGALMLAVAGLRLVALTINGTFAAFRWSPHVRATTAALACLIWFQVFIGIWISAPASTGLGTYRLIFLLEFWNLWRAGRDTGVVKRKAARDGR